jgi:hypothetical protein
LPAAAIGSAFFDTRAQDARGAHGTVRSPLSLTRH